MNENASVPLTDPGIELVGTREDETLTGGDGDDILSARGGRDVVQGGAGDDVIDGGGGRDLLFGQEDNDQIDGGRGADRLFGGNGDDVLTGGRGNDSLNGGNGDDTFVFAGGEGRDRIFDFDRFGDDRLELNIAGIDSFDDVLAAATQVGSRVRLDFGEEGRIDLIRNDLSDLDESDFIFA